MEKAQRNTSKLKDADREIVYKNGNERTNDRIPLGNS